MHDPAKALALAEQVSQAADTLGIRTALIGAAALAVHGYMRGTQDLDLATAVLPETLRDLLTATQAATGRPAELRLPDDEDPLGGVLVLWASNDENGRPSNPVEIINFFNPLRPVANPAAHAIARSVELEGLHLRCVTLADLVALKLYAGSRGDLADIVQLVAHNPEADLDEVRTIAKPFDKANCLDELLTEAFALQAGKAP